MARNCTCHYRDFVKSAEAKFHNYYRLLGSDQILNPEADQQFE